MEKPGCSIFGGDQTNRTFKGAYVIKGAENHDKNVLPKYRLCSAKYESEIRFPQKKNCLATINYFRSSGSDVIKRFFLICACFK